LKQVLQHLRSGEITVAEVPGPAGRPGHLLVQTTRSLISAGTERMLVEFGQAGLIAKARSQPEKVRQVLTKIKTDGLLPTLETVFSRLDEPLPLGYCNVGRLIEVGAGVQGFSVGDRVVSNGPHAELVCVPATLAARVPDGVDDESASFTVLSAIALNGVRLLEPTLGERFVVFGLGLLGIVAVQLLQAHGCHVLGLDVSPERCERARSLGCATYCAATGADPTQAASAFARGHGVDGVLITASAKHDQIMQQSAEMCRKKGRMVLVGVVDLNLRRADFYEKELSFQVACSYGPGRYDPSYEAKGRDYPRAYVRWTVARNLEAILDALAVGRLDVRPLITKTFPHHDAAQAYDTIVNDRSALGVVMTYPEQPAPIERVVTARRVAGAASEPAKPVVGVIGAGNYAKQFLLPSIGQTKAPIKVIADLKGAASAHLARKFEVEQAASEADVVLESPEINVVFIATQHNTHAPLVAAALDAGKHVFVEKPLAIDESGLELVRRAHAAHPDRHIMVGFNRRFAPHTLKVRELLAGRSQPLAIQFRVNAGYVPPDTWYQDPEVGGGRIIGEGCHFIDLAMYLVGHPIASISAVMFGPQAGDIRDDKMSINTSFADGSIATVHYWANGPKSYPKETVEIFTEGRALIIENWRRLRGYDFRGVPRMNVRKDKGHQATVAEFLERVAAGGPPLIPFEELELVTRASFAAVRAARENVTIHLVTDGE
jgi:predicted dehydrogenase/threonine dehydrogenase-like Zn-dependent dehydrogenase